MSVTNGIFIVGDSFSDDSHQVFDQWPALIANPPTLRNGAESGDALIIHIEPNYAADVAALTPKYNIAVLQGGVNDLNGAATTGDIQTAMSSCISTAQGAGLNVIVINVAPWKNASGWNAGDQTQTDDYNAWLLAQSTIQGFTLVDIYTPLEDGSNPDELAPAYDVGDSLHPNAAGQAVITGLMDAAIAPFIVDVPDVANSLSTSRGAVEPAGVAASGNQLKMSRGAVEPGVVALMNPSGPVKKPGFLDIDSGRNRRENRYSMDQSNDASYRLGEDDAPDIGTYDNKRRNRYS